MSEAVQDFELNIDVSAVDAWDGISGPKIDPGPYTLLVADAEKSNSKTSNQPVLAVTFEVATEGQFFGVRFKRSYSLQQSAMGRYKQLVMACRAPLTNQKKEHFVGAYINAEIIHKDGKPQAQMDGSMAPGKPTMDVINEQPADDGAQADDGQAAVQAAAAAAAEKAAKDAAAAAAANAAAANKPNGAAATRPVGTRRAAATATK